MRALTPFIVSVVTGGEVRGILPAEEVAGVVTDSRAVEPGFLFAAIPGERVDGHDFVAQAVEKGAACVLCSRFQDVPVPQICVPDVPAALRQIAAYYRGLFSIPFIGVTGSVGKTTAKEMIAAVLSARFQTLKTAQNFNNELGVPLTLFCLRDAHEAAVVEMGISRFGEMTRLTEMVRPDIGVFTQIGDAHLEFLGDRAGVLRAKSEMVQGMGRDALIIANGDDALLRSHDFGRRTVYFGFGEDCDVRAANIQFCGTDSMCCSIMSDEHVFSVRIPAFGRHMIYAALMGAAVGLSLGMSGEEIAAGIARYETVGSRCRVLHVGDMLLLDDCYNANPTSVKSALESLLDLPGRHVAVLGDMRELGETGAALHREVGQLAAQMGIAVITCGRLAKEIAAGAGHAPWYEDTAGLLEELPRWIQPGDAVLVKASRAMGFEVVTQALCDLAKYRLEERR